MWGIVIENMNLRRIKPIVEQKVTAFRRHSDIAIITGLMISVNV